jgi:hypothetical protein
MNGDILLVYLGQTALRREQCDSMHEILISNYKQQIATQRSKLSYGNEKSIVTSVATEALLGQKLSNGITADGYRGIADMQIVSVVSEHRTSQVS